MNPSMCFFFVQTQRAMTSMRGMENSSIVGGGEDEDAWIEAEIQRELEALSSLSEGDLARSVEEEEEDGVEEPDSEVKQYQLQSELRTRKAL